MKINVNSITLKSDAARYENAIRAVAGIASMTLENPDVLKSALAILDREGPNLRFHGSQLIVLGLNDYTFTASVKKASPDKASAEALIKQVRANPKAVLKLDGAQLLAMRLRQSTEADVATLRRVAGRFKDAASKFERSAKGEQQVSSNILLKAHDFFELILLIDLIATIADLFAFASLLDSFAELIRFLTAMEECQEAANKRRAECVSSARSQMIPNLAAEVQCGFGWATQAAQCLLTAISTTGRAE